MGRLLNPHGLLLLLSAGMALLFLRQVPESRRIARVVQQGRVVPVEVVRGSTARFSSRAQSYVDFRYAGREHSVRVSHAFRQQVNDAPTTALLHLPEYPACFCPLITTTRPNPARSMGCWRRFSASRGTAFSC